MIENLPQRSREVLRTIRGYLEPFDVMTTSEYLSYASGRLKFSGLLLGVDFATQEEAETFCQMYHGSKLLRHRLCVSLSELPRSLKAHQNVGSLVGTIMEKVRPAHAFFAYEGPQLT